jgi:N4-gp56 family major capsid protein
VTVAITDTTVLSDFIRTAYQGIAYKPLRTELIYRQLISPGMVKWTSGSDPQPGQSVVFSFVNDLSETATTISESVDVTPQSLADTQLTVSVQEYGAAVVLTQRLNAVNILGSLNPIAAERIGRQMAAQLDNAMKAVAQAGSNVVYPAALTARNTITASGHNITSALVRKVVAKLRANGAMPVRGANYAAIIHPDVSVDLRTEGSSASQGGWRPVHEYQMSGGILNGEVGQFEGAIFLETPRAPLFVDAGGSSTVDVYATLFVGQEAFAEAIGYQPQVVISPVTDLLRRFQGVGWKALIGWGRFREGALYRLESASSIGAN